MSRRGTSGWIRWALLFGILLTFWLPRGLELDRYVTDDERLWLTRSANFYQALSAGEFADTYQREHPGVTVMWAGTTAFLWQYPAYVSATPGQLDWETLELAPILRANGHDPMALLAAGRAVLVLALVVVLLAAFFYAERIFGTWPAAVGMLLVAFDPFHIALSRLLHLDALLSSLMLLSVLAAVWYLRTKHRAHVIISALAAALAWLTKVPGLFLMPFLGAVFIVLRWEDVRSRLWRSLAGDVVLWAGIALIVTVAGWPALWVAPVQTLQQTMSETVNYATGEEHMTTIFFAGDVLREVDPGVWFYPINYLWRTTPVVLLGLPAALIAAVRRWMPLGEPSRRHTAGVLIAFALLYLLTMTLGAKKLDRYMLPAHAPLDLVAGFGLYALGRRLYDAIEWGNAAYVATTLIAGGLVLHAGLSLSTYPYFLSYFNPMLGGSTRASQVLMIGRGEGLDQAAAYLNNATDTPENLNVLTWSTDNIAYLLDGNLISHTIVSDPEDEPTVSDLMEWVSLDYVVLYVHQWQRRLIVPEFLEYLSPHTPEKRIVIDGLEYARIYNVRGVLPPDYLALGAPRFTDWNETIRLLSYELPRAAVPGEPFQARFYLQNIAPIDRNLNVLVRIVGQNGEEFVRDEGWPWGTPTSQWQRYEVWPDGHELTIPEGTPAGFYRVDLSFYDPETLELLPATDARTGKKLGTDRTIDYVRVGDVPATPEHPLPKPAHFGDRVTLLGTDSTPELQLTPGETMRVRAYWQATAGMSTDHTTFVHLIGPDGTLAAQHDKQPLDGFFPTSYWHPVHVVPDTYAITLPADAPAGSYNLRAGVYDPATGTRLTVPDDMDAGNDAVSIATVTIN